MAAKAAATNNLRAAGQYVDAETATHQNYLRNYDPNTGSYTQTDPIGLSAGRNTYGDVDAYTTNTIDPTGEIPLIPKAPA